jgi:regulator of protease activity HflC (stomatin/prohibitin superfamily)
MESLHMHPHGASRKTSDVTVDKQDPGTESLSEALRISFWLLKAFMVIIVVLYLFSGVFTVDGNKEFALIFRFGRIKDEAASRAMTGGLRWAWPFPIETHEIISRSPRRVEIKAFLPASPDAERALQGETPMPKGGIPGGEGGYVLTGDRNMLNMVWSVSYQISDPVDYYCNRPVGVSLPPPPRDPNRPFDKPQVRFEETQDKAVERLVRTLVETSVIRASGSYSVYDAYVYKTNKLKEQVQKMVQDQLDELKLGIRIADSGLNLDMVAPAGPNVKAQFDEVFRAEQEVDRQKKESYSYRNRILSETAGPNAASLVAELNACEDAITAKKPPEEIAAMEKQFSEHFLLAGGEVSKILRDAQIYASLVQEETKGDAVYLTNLVSEKKGDDLRQYLAQYRIQKLNEILGNAEDKYFLSTSGIKSRLLRIQLTPPKELIDKQRRIEETR